MKFKGYVFMALMLSLLLVFAACTPKAAVDNMKPADKAGEEMTEEAPMEDADQEADKMDGKTMIVYTFDGQEVNLLDGQRTYVKAWASWCSICLSGLGEVDELFASDTDFRVVTVVSPSNYGEQNEEDFKEWWNGLKSEYPNVEVLIDSNGEFFKDIEMRAFPTSVYINSNGEYQEKKIGHNANDLILSTMEGVE